MDGHVGRGDRGEAEVISESMAGIDYRWFVGVGNRCRGVGAVSRAAYGEPSKEGFEEEREKEWREWVTLQGAAVDVDRWSRSVRGVVVGGGDSV
jgi:hypothetical protein